MSSTRMWVVLCLLAAGGTPALAQVGAGQITGVVKDASGGVIPGATVMATNVDTAASRRVVTSAAGVYTLAGLPPGVYRVDVDLLNFRPNIREGIKVETGETIRLDVRMAIGELEPEKLIVSGDAPLLRTATASLGEVVSQEKITSLPLNGRTFITLAALAPGVALPPTSCSRASTAGARAPTNISSTASPSFSPSRGRSRSFRSSMRFRNSRLKATALRPNSAASTAV